MKYSNYDIGDIIDFDGNKFKLIENRILQGKDKKKGMTIITVLSFVTIILLYAVEIGIIRLLGLDKCMLMSMRTLIIMFTTFVVAFFAFIVVHEYLHHAAYRFIGGTPKDKLKFGVVLRQGMAYCISLVPNTVKASRVSLMMPIYVIIIPLTIISILTGNKYLAILTAAFFSGSAGDLWYMWTLRNTPKDLYVLEEEPESKGKDYELGYYVLEKIED